MLRGTKLRKTQVTNRNPNKVIGHKRVIKTMDKAIQRGLNPFTK